MILLQKLVCFIIYPQGCNITWQKKRVDIHLVLLFFFDKEPSCTDKNHGNGLISEGLQLWFPLALISGKRGEHTYLVKYDIFKYQTLPVTGLLL